MIHIKASPGYLAIVLLITLFALTSPVYAASPDLTVSSIWLEKASAPGIPVTGNDLAPNDSFNIVANVTNLGQATAQGFYVDVYYDSSYGRGGPDNIAPGEVQQWFIGPLTATPGAHTTRWVVDPDNQIAELNETNNQKQYTFTIRQQVGLTANSTTTASAISNSTIFVTTTSTVTSSYTTTVTATTSNGATSTVTVPNWSTTVTSTTTTTATVSSSSTSSSSSRIVSTTSSKTGSTTAQTTSGRTRPGRNEIYYLLPTQDASSWWDSVLLLIIGAWLVLRLPHHVTRGLTSASQFAKLGGRRISKQ
ncbi:MAG: CARDB domain-containing protein [Candidatus Bathyarchaeia archaeon]